MPRQRPRLARDSLLDVTVGGDHERVVIDDLVAFLVEPRREHPLREREPDGVADALAQRPGGDLDARHVAVLGMAGGARAELAELHDVLLETDLVTREVQRRVQEHRSVAAGEHEAVAIGPLRVARVVLHHA